MKGFYFFFFYQKKVQENLKRLKKKIIKILKKLKNILKKSKIPKKESQTILRKKNQKSKICQENRKSGEKKNTPKITFFIIFIRRQKEEDFFSFLVFQY